MNDSRVFVDTNIFLYASLEDDFQQGKRTGAVNLLKGLSDKIVYINTQVLHEFYSVMLRHGASDESIHDRLNDPIVNFARPHWFPVYFFGHVEGEPVPDYSVFSN